LHTARGISAIPHHITPEPVLSVNEPQGIACDSFGLIEGSRMPNPNTLLILESYTNDIAVDCYFYSWLRRYRAGASSTSQQGSPSRTIVATVIGLVSEIVDSVPLVAAGIEMYGLAANDPFWMMLAYCAGTGGSCLIIGSAAGVAAMGLEHIDFMWYVRKITPLALLGYFAGMLVYLLQATLAG
jgi:hypothetical protein